MIVGDHAEKVAYTVAINEDDGRCMMYERTPAVVQEAQIRKMIRETPNRGNLPIKRKPPKPLVTNNMPFCMFPPWLQHTCIMDIIIKE